MKKTALISIAILFFAAMVSAQDVKESDLAGSWYPNSKAGLEALLGGYLKDAQTTEINGTVIAIISPHAGYQFSGPVAAYGFKAVQDQDVKTVVIVGFSHRIPFNGISIYDRASWRTPLGEVKIDEDLAKEIISKDQRIQFEPALFMGENSVEMEIPFVQMVFKDAKIVPIAFGTQDFADAKILAEALSSSIGHRQGVLMVASTDLSHYHPYDDAVSIDAHTMHVLKSFNVKAFYDEANVGICELCGFMPVTAVMLASQGLGYDKIKILKYANSGDTTGEKNKVVGYLSAVIYKEGARPVKAATQKTGDLPMLTNSQRIKLLQIARDSITSYVRDGQKKEFVEKDPGLNELLGAFVTLHENGELRGCIGNMIGREPLHQTIADMSVEAATNDWRFPPLSRDEIDKIDIEISVLSPLKKVSSYKEIKIPGHGVLVRSGFKSGVYLPQVATETGWDREKFLTSLCGQKAGLASDAWKDPATELYVFSAEIFGEKDAKR